MRVAIYTRVSTSKQDTEAQIEILKEYAQKRGWEIVAIYQEKVSGAGKKRRRQFEKLMKEAKQRKFDIVLVFRFDRFSRSMRELINSLEEFKTLGIDFVSFSENVDTTTPTGQLMFQIFSAFAEFERNIIRERIKAGLENARRKGKRLGRPPKKLNAELIVKLKNAGWGYRRIAKKFKVSHQTIKRVYESVTKTLPENEEKKTEK